jgi:hypothetical protein
MAVHASFVTSASSYFDWIFGEREKWSKDSIFMTHCKEDRPTAPRLIARGTL